MHGREQKEDMGGCISIRIDGTVAAHAMAGPNCLSGRSPHSRFSPQRSDAEASASWSALVIGG